jgi:hypothetical protein
MIVGQTWIPRQIREPHRIFELCRVLNGDDRVLLN